MENEINGVIKLADATRSATARATRCKKEDPTSVYAANNLDGVTIAVLMNEINRVDALVKHGDPEMARLFHGSSRSFESDYRMWSYRWNELKTYNSFLMRCIFITAVSMILIVLSERAMISPVVLQTVIVLLVMAMIFMAIIEYSMLKLRVRSDFHKIRF